MAEEQTMTPDATLEGTQPDPIGELSTRLETMEQTFQEQLSAKEAKIAELTDSVDKQRSRRKSAEKKLKGVISKPTEVDEDVDTPDTPNDSYDVQNDVSRLREEMLFIRENPDYKGDDLKAIQQLSKEKGVNLSDAKIFYEYKTQNDPQLKAQREQAKLGSHGKYAAPKVEGESDFYKDAMKAFRK